MSDRLVLYNPETNKYVVFAKDFGQGYSLGNVNDLMKFLDESYSWNKLTIGDLDILPDEAENINTDNHWIYYPMEKHEDYIAAMQKINDMVKNRNDSNA